MYLRNGLGGGLQLWYRGTRANHVGRPGLRTDRFLYTPGYTCSSAARLRIPLRVRPAAAPTGRGVVVDARCPSLIDDGGEEGKGGDGGLGVGGEEDVGCVLV